MEFGDKVVRFNIPDSLQPTNEDHSIFKMEVLELLVQEALLSIINKQPFIEFLELEVRE